MLFNNLAEKISHRLSDTAEPTLNVMLLLLILVALVVMFKGNTIEKALLITWYVTP